MSDGIIDLTRYIKREPASDLPRGSMTLWGGDGERSRFALPLWRIIHLAQAERGLILWSNIDPPRKQTAFVALDLAADPARTDVDPAGVPKFGPEESPSLVDLDFVNVSPVYNNDINELNPVIVPGAYGGIPAVNALGLRRGLLAYKIIDWSWHPAGYEEKVPSYLPYLQIEVVDPVLIVPDPDEVPPPGEVDQTFPIKVRLVW